MGSEARSGVESAQGGRRGGWNAPRAPLGVRTTASEASLGAQSETGLELGVFGGGIGFTDLNDTDEGEFFGEEGTPAELGIETSGVLGIQGEYWFTDRVALRAEGGWTPATLQAEPQDAFGDQPAMPETDIADMDIYLADLSAVVRLLPAETTVTPYVTAGGGVMVYDPQGDMPITVDRANARIPPTDTESGSAEGNADTQLAGMVGLGAEFSPDGWPVNLHAEVTDHMAASPAQLLVSPEDDEAFPGSGAGVDANDDFDTVHNLRFQLGLQWTPGSS